MLSKKLAMVAMVSSFGLASAHAADAPNYKNAPMSVAPIAIEDTGKFNWTGFHLGVNGGGAKAGEWKNWDADGKKAVTKSKYPIAGVGGFQAGYDHQFGQFVLGIEGDMNFSFGPIRKATVERPEIKDGKTVMKDGKAVMRTDNDKFSMERLYTVRARGGFAVDRMLVYATGGWANMNLKPNKTLKAEGVKSKTLNGWTVGGGLEYAVTDNLSVRGEYLYVDMPKNNFYAGIKDKKEKLLSNNLSIFRAGLNYKF